MNRRSFLQFLGLAPVAPTVLAALPAASVLPEPWLPPETLPISDFAVREIERITGIGGLPQTNFRGVNIAEYAPTLGEWASKMGRAQARLMEHEPDRISPPLRA